MLSRALGVLLALPLLASLLLAPASASSSQPKAGPDHHRPKVGACYDYGLRGLAAVSGPKHTVSCGDSHRSVIVAVPRVRGKIDRADPKTFDRVAVRCYRAMYKALGGTQSSRALTAYSLSYYVPTREELDRGARWVRCDLVLYGGTRLMPLPDPLLPATPDDSTALCLLDDDKPATVCSRKHRYRATGTVAVKGRAYPGETKLDAIGVKKCDTRTTGSYVWRYPPKQSWRAGRHVVTCFTKTRA